MSENILRFESLTVFVLATNEKELLRKTVEEIRKNCNDSDLEKIVIVAKSRDCSGYLETQKLIEECTDGKIELYVQKDPDCVRCFSELPPMVKSSHFVVMGSDMEMYPGNINDFIEKAKDHPERIICASKWIRKSTVEGYGFLHEIGSRVLNDFVALLFNKKAKDIFSVYQIYPTSVYKKIKFDSASTFIYEYTLKPLRLGFEYEEIPTVYKKRTEGKSNVNVLLLLRLTISFCITALRIRFTPKRYLLNEKTHR